MKRKTASRKKKSATVRKTGGRKSAVKKAAPKKKTARKTAGRKSAPRVPRKKKKTVPRAGTRPVPPSSRPQPVPPGNEQPPQFAGGEDEHGPMHIPSHKPAPAYAEMHKRDWAGAPPHNIPIPKH